MTKRYYKKTGFIVVSIIIILALIFSIIFLLRFNSSKKQKNNTSPKEEPGVIKIFEDPKYLDLSKYKDQNGQLKPVDTAIKAVSDSEYKYANTTNNFQTFFPETKSESKNIKIQRDNASITFEIISQLFIEDQDKSSYLNFTNSQTVTSDDKQRNRIKYSQIFKKEDVYIDAVYTVHPDKLQEEIIINKFLGTPQISQKLKLVNTYASQQDGQIYFYQKGTNHLLWTIPQAKMYEQKRPNNISQDIFYELKCEDESLKLENCDQLILTKRISQEGQKWLADPKRQYPVVIDPDFQIDNADTAANWTSSDTTNFTVSQETTIKQEGTGSIKIVGVATTSFWGISGSPDSGCNVATTTPATVYTTCSSGVCQAGSWGSCQYSSRSYTTIYSNCWRSSCCGGNGWSECKEEAYCQSGYSIYSSAACSDPLICCGYYMYYNYMGYGSTYNVYTFSGSCSSDGSGSCYQPAGSSQSGYINTSSLCSPYYNDCSELAATGYSSYSTCTWTAAKTGYSVSNSVTRLTGSGTCSSDGSGSCFKLTQDGSSTYTSSGACPSSACNGASQRYQLNSNCTWTSNSSLNDTATRTTTTDLSTSKSITFWVRSTRTGTFMNFQMGESVSTEQTFPVIISSANTWEQKTWDISGISTTARDAITKFAFQATDSSAGFTFYFDDIQAVAAASITPAKCFIDESIDDTYLKPMWTDNFSDEDGFKLEKSTNGGAFTQIQTLGAGVTGYQDISISQGNTYAYRVRSYKGSENSDYCTTDTLTLESGSLKLEGVQLEGVRLN
ncbi:MAG TPA: hypothetical protein PK257_02505 [Candidatus Woesebacteria bacterium]|nr:hypothetical protein [Candidatus Woesebacteria bacterium]